MSHDQEILSVLATCPLTDPWQTDASSVQAERILSAVRDTGYDIVPSADRPRMTPVGIVEIADLLNVQRGTVDQWIHRGIFPDPRWTVGGRPAWEQTDVEAWAKTTGRLTP